MDRTAVELSALGFQAFVTVLLALVYWGLWRHRRRPHFATWAAAWAAFALRLGCISAYLVTRDEAWLFAHQAATGVTALLLLWAALQFSRGTRWRRRYLWLAGAAIAWAYVAVFVMRDMRTAGLSGAVLMAGVSLWTGVVFWRYARVGDRPGARVLSWTFLLWGVHHLDYPLLRALGSAVLYGVFADVAFIGAASIGTLFLVLDEDRRALEGRRRELEELSRLLLRAQEDERRRIGRELHDEAGQILTAVKIELDLEGRTRAGEMVGRALGQLRDLSNLLRPLALDDLGLSPALRGLVEEFARTSRIEATLECPQPLGVLPPDVEVAVYRVIQEALTNVARHAGARHVRVRVASDDGLVRLAVEDDGRGVPGEPEPHLGLRGIRERVSALGGRVHLGGAPGGGFRIAAEIPLPGAA